MKKAMFILITGLLSFSCKGQERFDTTVNVVDNYNSRTIRATCEYGTLMWVINDSAGLYKYDGQSRMPLDERRTPRYIVIDTIAAIISITMYLH